MMLGLFASLERLSFWKLFLFVAVLHVLLLALFTTGRYFIRPMLPLTPPALEGIALAHESQLPAGEYPPLDASVPLIPDEEYALPQTSADAFSDLLQDWRAPRVPAPKDRPSSPPPSSQATPSSFDALLRKMPTTGKDDDSYSQATSLTPAESVALNGQFRACWHVQGGSPNPENLKVVLKLIMNPDATVRQIVVMDEARIAKDPFFRVAVERAVQSFSQPECRQLQLPLSEYHRWRVVYMEFNPYFLLQ